jgi:hypothetical protein
MEGESFSFRRTLQGGLAECLQAPELGGLGLPNLELMGYALRLRWMWHRKTGTNKPWITLPGKLEQPLSHIFHYSTTVNVGDGTSTLFWTDRWLKGRSIAELAPCLIQTVALGFRG